ncbi:type IV pilin N-terminal domain-containing protein [Methanomicrobium mobile]|uniref:type IV pilin N-terminal domain-containing protein n=1 Tax=Methanomicrobium mobile TaxID=2205 RepID=UPI0005B28B16|nr:type IV pilin N-terminal domain-containing protein [Methanomicrobium mobile]
MSKIFNNALFEAKERESAVSPVVGVMLMLVVTIIIAATVSAFAGGLVGTADKAPQAAFDVKIVHSVPSWGMGAVIEPTMTITHLGGDPIDTARTKIVTSWTNRTSKEIYYRETTALPASKEPQAFNDYGGYVNLSLEKANANETTCKFQDPYLVIPKKFPSSDSSLWFGNYILRPGDVMKAQASLSSYNYVDPDPSKSWSYSVYGYKDYSVINNAEWLTDRDVVNVKIIDIPTGQIIFDKDIYVVEA